MTVPPTDPLRGNLPGQLATLVAGINLASELYASLVRYHKNKRYSKNKGHDKTPAANTESKK